MLHSDFIPAPQKTSSKLLVALHGLGDSMEGYRWMPEALQIPDLNYLLVNAPDSYYGGFSWYDFDGVPGPGIQRSRQFLFDLLDKQRVAGFPTEQTVILGFSQGCLMTLEVGLRYPHRLAGLVGISGYPFEPEQAVRELSPVAKQQKFLITHGMLDPLIPLEPVRKHIEMFQANGLQMEWQEFKKDHTIIGPELKVIRDFILKCLP